MTQKILITLATSNKHKVEEINLIAKEKSVEFILPSGEFNPVEVGKTFLENARIKALCATKAGETELYLADDSGLCVEALDGEPGIYSARYAPTAKERINKLLNVMTGIENRQAKFVCAMVLCDRNENIVFETQGECLGSIMHKAKGEGGFGYDPIFYVKSKNKGMAELSDIEKSQVSHRSRALNKVLDFLNEKYIK